jgi:hypothetical protein
MAADSDDTALRVSDQDRDAAASEIREHFAAGRLSDEELSDRLSAVYRAKTSEELKALRSDLPVLPVTVRAELAHRRGHLQRRLLQEAGGGLVVFLICSVIWVAAGASGAFWPIWIALVALIPLLRNGWRLYGPSPELDRVEEDLERRRHRHDRRSPGQIERRSRRRL